MADVFRTASALVLFGVAAVASCSLDTTGSLFTDGDSVGASGSSGLGGAGVGGETSASVGGGGGNSSSGNGGGSTGKGAGGGAASTGVGGAGGAGGVMGAGGTGGSSGPTCGDGKVEAPESCDDMNTASDDGCSSQCMAEPSSKCPGNPVTLTPSGVTLTGVLASQGDDVDPSCGPDSLKDALYAVTPTVSGTMTATIVVDGNKSVSIRSDCPTSAAWNEIVCAENTNDVEQKIWVTAGQTYIVIVDAPDNANYTLKLSLTQCGDGVVQGLEQCDNPNDMACVGCVLCNGAGEFMDPATKHCYRLVDTPQSWKAARNDCVGWGGDLVGIRSKAEFDYLATHANPAISADTWVGGYAITPLCSYTWVNGEPWRSEWADNEPSFAGDLCLQMWQAAGKKLDDTACGNAKPYVCERAPAGSCGDGIVQPGEGCDDNNMVDGDGCSAACEPDVQCSALPSSFQGGNPSHCYWMPAGTANYNNAKNACAASGGYLVVIESSGENDLIKQHISSDTWIGGWEGGLNDKTIIWEYPSAACGYKNWDGNASMDTAEDCVRIVNGSGVWRDSGCNLTFTYFCERNY